MRPRPLIVLALALLMAAAAPMGAAQGDEPSFAELVGAESRHERSGVDADVARVLVRQESLEGDEGVFVGYDAPRAHMLVQERGVEQRRADEIDLRFLSLVEYRDLDEDGVIDPAEEPVIRRVPLSSLEWNARPVAGVEAEGERGHRLVATAPLPRGGQVGLALTTLGDYAAADASTPPSVERAVVDIALLDPMRSSSEARFALVADVAQRGAVGDVAPGDPFPWPESVLTTEGRVPLVPVLIDSAEEAGDERRERVALAFAGDVGRAPAGVAACALTLGAC